LHPPFCTILVQLRRRGGRECGSGGGAGVKTARARADAARFYNKRGTAEQWTKEREQAVKMTRLSRHRFRLNEVSA